MSVPFPLEARIFAKVTPRWVKRAAWLAAILAIGVALKLTVLRPKAIPVTVYRVAAGRVAQPPGP